jgi:hypothetical protein
MSKRILIVSPHFPPINAPDHQRVRITLPYLQDFGWESHILAVDSDYVEAEKDDLLCQTIPNYISITRTKALPIQQTKLLGISNLYWRCLPDLFQAGNQILSEEKFDLIYFSTTVFTAMILAPIWYHLFKIPYVLDFQDPWLANYDYNANGIVPPGGNFKYGFSQAIARIFEPQVMRYANHVISVSPIYPQILMKRYSFLKKELFTVLPFGASEQDFQQLEQFNIKQNIFDSHDGKKHFVYVGRVGEVMAFAVKSLFLAIQSDRQENPQKWEKIELHFVGTSYASGDRAIKTIEPMAKDMKIDDIVTEYPHRIPYFEALKILTDSHGILLIGSNDHSYSASKIYPCILAKKPILSIFHKESLVIDILNKCQVGKTVTFDSNNQPEDLLNEIKVNLDWLLSLPDQYQPSTNWTEFHPYTAYEMARKQCIIFDQCVKNEQ